MANTVDGSIGFTGTREGMTDAQKETVTTLLTSLYPKFESFHHGVCIGSDEQAAEIADELKYWTVGHPPTDTKYMSQRLDDEVREPLDYLDRNKAIVRESGLMIATPGGVTEVLRSGTWATIRYARQMDIFTHIVYPNGRFVPRG